jgi:hypothetical protein
MNARVRKIDPVSGIISTVAGNGSAGFSGDGGPATNAQLDHPFGVCLNHAGNILYIVDDFNYVVRKVDLTTGTITTIAGVPHVYGDSGDGGPATAAKFHNPVGMWIDGSDNLYVAGAQNNFIRKIDVSTGIASRFAGNGVMGCTTGDGGPATSAAIITPFGGCRDAYGNTYIVSNYASMTTNVRKVDASGTMHAFAGTCIGGFSGDGGPAIAAQVKASAIVSDPWGKVYLGDDGNQRLRVIDTNGIIHTISANPATGSTADSIIFLSTAKVYPLALCFDNFGNLYIGEDRKIRKVPHVFTPPEPGILREPVEATTGEAEVFPNPSGGIFTVRQKMSGHSIITVYNILSEKVYENPNAIAEQYIDLSGNPAGVYILNIKDEHITITKRILLN